MNGCLQWFPSPLAYEKPTARRVYLHRNMEMTRWELSKNNLETVPKNFQICTTGWQEAYNDPHKLPNADFLIKESTTITIPTYLTSIFYDSVLLGTLNERCTYPWVPSVQLLPWLVQVLFSRPLTFASALRHPVEPRKKYLLLQWVTSLKDSNLTMSPKGVCSSLLLFRNVSAARGRISWLQACSPQEDR